MSMTETPVTLRGLLQGAGPLVAPLALDPLMAVLAAKAGFKALYLGGGAMGYRLTATEANLTLTEQAEAGLQIRAATSLPLILDGACGWGDPMHMHRTVAMAEAAGFAAIEIEDQILPKRAYHHVGIEHCIPLELMVAKVREAVAARRSRDFLIIARTNIARTHGTDEAIRRCLAFHKAGADLLLPMWVPWDDMARVGQALPPPLTFLAPPGEFASMPLPPAELASLGYRLIIDPMTPLLAVHRVLRRYYAKLAAGEPDPFISMDAMVEHDAVLATIDIEKLLEIEQRTVER
jgi:2-methylisocitrate lyase-like PEP mutase family enzyme